tara:strand:+ start:3474 stop:4589 length:1116 start_codon:yes stop_codon:yes gene_type:complete
VYILLTQYNLGGRTIIKSFVTFLVVSVVAVLAFGSNYFSTKIDSSVKISTRTEGFSKVKVLTSKIVTLRSDRVFEALGTGKARLSAEIYPEVSAEVVKVSFKTQDKVKSGQLLVQLDDREAQLALKLARLKYSDAKKTLKRFMQATPTGASSQTELDRARTNHDTALLEIEQRRLDLSKRKILAPFDGVVGIPNVDPGDRVNLSSLITGVDDRRILHVDFEVPESLAGRLQNNTIQQIVASTPAFPRQTFQAILTAQESRVDPKRRTLMVRAQIDNSKDRLRPGMSFITRWEIVGESFPAVPEISLQWSRSGAYIWIVRQGTVYKVDVKVEARKASMVLVEGPVQIGDQVVIEGLQRLRDGLAVKVLGNDS